MVCMDLVHHSPGNLGHKHQPQSLPPATAKPCTLPRTRDPLIFQISVSKIRNHTKSTSNLSRRASLHCLLYNPKILTSSPVAGQEANCGLVGTPQRPFEATRIVSYGTCKTMRKQLESIAFWILLVEGTTTRSILECFISMWLGLCNVFLEGCLVVEA